MFYNTYVFGILSILLHFILLHTPVFASEKYNRDIWTPLKSISCNKNGGEQFQITLMGVIEDEVRQIAYDKMHLYNCDSTSDYLEIKYDQTSNRHLEISEAGVKLVGRPWSGKWRVPEDSNALIVTADTLRKGKNMGLYVTQIFDFIHNNTKNDEEFKKTVKGIGYFNDLCSSYMGYYNEYPFFLILIDAEQISKIDSCLSNMRNSD
ncbi:hypothetical protein T8K17_05350 [Thalassobaculum sp. OXR-137]|uniref:hypothetical protein n=1 Tax=Thalassobaculum sp. OXR-137 TaxID=3100173 RepID=UPI002AC904AA|nr:hypothetical protein [Thalassobaculum sp. OXR-137]WPZ35568.1 hypothetical protein T8K17_05350 [Thalassobaculum sp. OXR-137]